jgi:hypothetical protein
MEQVLVSKTKNYLILKIPLLAVKKKRRILIDDPARVAVLEGLKAVEKGRVSKTFSNAKDAVAFLEKI